MRVTRGEWESWLSSQKSKILASSPITSWQIDEENVETVTDFIFLDSKITSDGDRNHESRRCFLLGRKVMTNVDSILKKSRDILPTKVCIAKAIIFPVVMYGCKSWTIRKAEHRRFDAFELWCWRRFLRVPWTARRSKQSILKGIKPEYSLEGLVWSWSSNPLATWLEDVTNWKRPRCWERLRAGGKEDEMTGWHYPLNRHKCEQTPWDSEGQGRLACCSPWGCKESDMI